MNVKRFFKDRNELITWIRDKETWEKLKTDDEIVDKLNDLHEENQKYKQKVKEVLRKHRDDLSDMTSMKAPMTIPILIALELGVDLDD